MNLNVLFVAAAFMSLTSVTAKPLKQDFDRGEEEVIFPATTNAADTELSDPAPQTPAPAGKTSPVSELLNALFHQTIYARIESLILDPGRKTEEKQRLVDSAVINYHRQKMFGSDDGDDDDVESVTRDDSDILKSTGQSGANPTTFEFTATAPAL
jgi:hypothetical protein